MKVENQESNDVNILLANLVRRGIIDTTEVENCKQEMKTQKVKEDVLKKLNITPKLNKRSDGRCFTKIKTDEGWKQFSGISEEDVYHKLHEYLYGIDNITLSGFFPMFMQYRRDMHKVTSKTLYENNNDWKKYLADNPLVNIPMRKLTVHEYIDFFEKLTKDGTMTSKAVSNLKSLLNKLYSYAIRLKIVDHNPVKDVDFKEFNYHIPDNSEEVYTVTERQQLLDYLKDIIEPYSLAIQFDFHVTCRIGEIKALRWSDIDFDARTIYIHNQDVKEFQMTDDLKFENGEFNVVNRTKGNRPRGKRYIPMTSEAMRILMQAKDINPDGEFVFMPYGRKMLTDTFNEYLGKYCDAAGVPYHSSHKIRFTSCSTLYNGKNLTAVSKLMGHSQVATTLHYMRNVNHNDDVLSLMEESLE